ncbi:PREDICTED: CDGSH iron-sulfur domain-containing protein 3, mitochondrial-like [Acropora digitifera]|uniref:CDGSH iron-sulfur domain-containing protein 3, mitochondrial-like n=1 Tax=Acropora digitifera TaxID=70779 RepID=UPI00077A66C6|nr:PREDICTED: CDGSH iron-sulfur domain-containing protein 3, mitochondrial-like [Acropora digitifera]
MARFIMVRLFTNRGLFSNDNFCLRVQQAFCFSDVCVIAAKSPFQVELVEGKKYAWCKCGLSKKQPFCDGRHKTTTIQPIRFIAEETSSEVFLCGCKQTSSPPFCDGGRNHLPPFCDGIHVSEQVQSAEISQ